MWILILFLGLTGLWWARLNFEIVYRGGWKLYWLPWAGSGRSLRRELSRRKKKDDREGKDEKGGQEGKGSDTRLSHSFGRLVLRQARSHLRVDKWHFCISYGGSSFHCIAHIRLGHIIISMAKAAAAYAGEPQGEDKQWPLSMILRN